MKNHLYDALIGNKTEKDAILLMAPDATTLSYGAMEQRVAQFAAALVEAQASKGDRIAVQVAKSQNALALYLACLRQGLVFVPLNTAYTASEVAYFVENAEPSVIVVDPSAQEALSDLAEDAGAKLFTMDETGSGSFAAAAEAATATPAPADCGPDDLACFLYTSGTTGRSKGAMLTHTNLLSNAETLARTWHFSAEDRLLHALPIFHTHGLFVACNVLMFVGGSMIWLPSFKTEDVLAHLPTATTMMGVPTFYTRLLQSAAFDRQATEHIRLFTSGSAPLLAETYVQFSTRTGHAILERYGMTETGINTSNPYEGERRPGTVGFPLDGIEVQIVDSDTRVPLEQGQTGMIEVRGPNVFKGYWRMPEKTAEELHDDGFFITGDLGLIDPDGYVTIVGRQKDLIITGGYNVYPKEVELVLDDQPGVIESAVIGVPHPDFGEAVVGIIVAADASLDLQSVLSAVSGQLANYKRPKQLVLADALPRNTLGKVQKNILREAHNALFQAKD